MADIDRYTRAMDRMMDSFFGSTGRRFPPVDIREDKKSYTIECALAGYTADDVNIYVENHVLRISGKASQEKAEGRRYLVRERSPMDFERSFTMPEDADEEGLEAGFRNGILTIEIAKKAKEEPRKIEVRIN